MSTLSAVPDEPERQRPINWNQPGGGDTDAPPPGTEVVAYEDVDGDGTPDLIVAPVQDIDRPGAELVPATGTELVRKSAPLPQVMVRGNDDLRPIIPPWMTERAARRAVIAWWVARQKHKAKFHGVRTFAYAWRITVRTPRGAGVLFTRWNAWVWDTRADAAEQALALSDGGDEKKIKLFMELRDQRARRVRNRWVLTVLGFIASLGVVAGLVVVLHLLHTHVGFAAQVAAAAGLGAVAATRLAKLGTPVGTTVVTQVVVMDPRMRIMTPEILFIALRNAGLGGTGAKVDKDGNVLEEANRPTLPAPIARSANGLGYEVLVDLPRGRTVADALEVLPRIASGLDVDTPQVLIEPVRGMARRGRLYVADVDPFETPAPAPALLAMPRTSVWVPNRLGASVGRGVSVEPTLIFNSALVGARPRRGKTFLARLLVAPAMLDPFCDMVNIDLKGGKDWKAAGDGISLAYVVGDDLPQLDAAIGLLDAERERVRRVFEQFRKMSDRENPESKLTPEMGERYGIFPRVIVVDEVQNLLRASDKDMRAEALELLVWLSKTAPAAGTILVLATQRPAAEVVPEDLRANIGIRAALATMTWQGSDAILGGGQSKAGWSSHTFLDHHLGRAIVRGVPVRTGGDLVDMRTDHLTNDGFARIAQVGRQRRVDAGRLAGHAAGVDEVVISSRVVDDLYAVWPGSEPKVHAAYLLQRLRNFKPETYGNPKAEITKADVSALTAALKRYQVPAGQVWFEGKNSTGYELVALQRALGTRNRADES